MSFIGNPLVSQAFVTDSFSGNGSTTAFTMSVAPATTAAVLVAISGVVQDPSTYSIVGTTLTFSQAPPSATANISTRYLGIPSTGVTSTAYRTVTEFTATAAQTTFTPPSFTPGFVNVYRNGVLLGFADYVASSGTTVVLNVAANLNDLITVESFLVSSVLNAIPNTTGSVVSNNLSNGLSLVSPNLGTPTAGVMSNVTSLPASQLTGSQAIPRTTLPPGTVVQVQSAYVTSATQLTSSGTIHELTTALRVSITPIFATSILYFDVFGSFMFPSSANLQYAKIYDVTNSTFVNLPPSSGSRQQAHWINRTTPYDANDGDVMQFSITATNTNTTARTYTVYHGTEGAVAQFLQSTLASNGGATMPLMFKVTEVAA